MLIRTYTRILFNDIFKNNFVAKFVKRIVNFYCDLWFKDHHAIKFTQNLPTTISEEKKNLFFLSVTGDKIDCK